MVKVEEGAPVGERDRIVQEITAGKAPRLRAFILEHGGVAEVAKKTGYSAANLQRMLDRGALPRRNKLRAIVAALVPESPREMTDQDYARVIAKLGGMRGRGGVEIGFTPISPRVPAKNPKELGEEAERALVEAALEEDPS